MAERVIKFRAWVIKNKCWFSGPWEFNINEPLDEGVKENYVIQQFTGYKDINKKEIYEGDYIQVFDHKTGIPYPATQRKVVWLAGGLVADHSNSGWIYLGDFLDKANHNVQVIGNIFEDAPAT